MKFNKKDLDIFRWSLTDGAPISGRYDMPVIQAVTGVQPHNLIPFSEATVCKKPFNCWTHFYVDDYRFERVWRYPRRYLPILQRFEGVLSPDYSMYLDMPKPQQIWNCWRNRCLTWWLQSNGVCVIPNVGWSDSESLSWAFDGIPENSVLSITTQGCMNDHKDRDLVCKQSLVNGLHALIREKRPERIIVYGLFPESWLERFNVPLTIIEPFMNRKEGEV